jgi:hypothetical protein
MQVAGPSMQFYIRGTSSWVRITCTTFRSLFGAASTGFRKLLLVEFFR